MRIASLLTGAAAALLFAVSVSAQIVPRYIPADAPRGSFTAGKFPEVTINGKPMRLAPGARILNANNLTVTPNQVAADTPVRYRLDPQGRVQTVWILGAQEASKR
jgi:hypothetical protein